MPITNNLITIDGDALRPAPQFNISHETFKAGEYIIGGLTKISITGEIYGTSDTDLVDKIQDISSYSATCKEIIISCDNQELINGSGFIKSVSLNATDQPFVVNYTLDIEVSNIDSNNLSVLRDSAFETLLDITIPDHINLKSYDENISIVGEDSLSNSVIYSSRYYTKAELKLSGQISIQAHHHTCDDNTTIIEDLYSLLEDRFDKILTLNSSLATSYPSIASYCNNDHELIHDNKTFTINKLDNKVTLQFDMYIIPKVTVPELPALSDEYPKAVIDFSVSETVDQFTGLNTLNVKGSIKGLGNRSSGVLDNKILLSQQLANARSAYTGIIQLLESREYNNTIASGCYEGILPYVSNSCYNRISSQITENLHGGQIDFDLTYGDIESCQLGSNNIEISITEDFPTKQFIEHIIPGRLYPVIQIGNNFSPLKITITVTGKLNGCDIAQHGVDHIGSGIRIVPYNDVPNGNYGLIEYVTETGQLIQGSLLPILINCVEQRLIDEVNNRGYNSYLLSNETKTLGKYSYKITQSYIGNY